MDWERTLRGWEGCAVHTKQENKVSFSTQQNTQHGHQFKGCVIWIIGIKAFHAAQSIVDILGRPIWWCEAGHDVVVIKL